MSLPDYVIYDVECTNRAPAPLFGADPTYIYNRPILVGTQSCLSGNRVTNMTRTPHVRLTSGGRDVFLVAHNAKFDLRWAIRGDYFRDVDDEHVHIWDTQYAEYLLSGQTSIMASLDDLAAFYGLKPKSGILKTALESGMAVEGIPLPELQAYLMGDLALTEAIFKEQWHAMESDPALLKLMMIMSDTMKALAHIEHQGMDIDVGALNDAVSACKDSTGTATASLTEWVEHFAEDLRLDLGTSAVAMTPTHLKSIMYEGVLNLQVKVQVGVYKSGLKRGQPKWHNATLTIKPTTHVPTPLPTATTVQSYDEPARAAYIAASRYTLGARPGTPLYALRLVSKAGGVDQATRSTPSSHVSTFVDIVGQYHRESNTTKVLSTYLLPWQEMVTARGSNKIHANFNVCSTRTGRLSSSKPNFQNVPLYYDGDQPVKGLFKAPSGYVIMEADYAQLEVVVGAFWTGSKNLKENLRRGVDVHDSVGSSAGFTLPMDKATRRNVKGVVFGTLYGGGVATISKQTGVPVPIVKKVQRAFHSLYPEFKAKAARTLASLDAVAMFSSDKTESGVPTKVADLRLPTGRKIEMKQYDSTYNPEPSFSYNQACNYPVQALATADIVPIMLGILWRNLRESTLDAKLVNTVHDSVVLLVPQDQIERTAKLVRTTLESVPHVMKALFDIDFDLATPVEIEVGPSWGELTVLPA